MVQFVEDPSDRSEYAVKFFLDRHAFLTEAALYASGCPQVAATLSLDAIPDLAPYLATSNSAYTNSFLPEAVARFLPQVEAIHDEADERVDPARGRPLPPCIVMEKGESLFDCSGRAAIDLFTKLAVRASGRLSHMHVTGAAKRLSPLGVKCGFIVCAPGQLASQTRPRVSK